MEAIFVAIGKGQVWLRAAGAVLAVLGLAASGRAATFGRVIPIGGQSSDLVLDEPRGVLYVSNFTAKRIEVISLSSGTRRQPITVTAQPGSIDLSPDGRYIITGHYGNFEAPLSPDNGVTLPFPGQPVPASPRSSMPATARSGRCPTTATPRRTTRLTRWPKSTVRCDGTTEIPAGSTSTSEPARRSPSSGSTSSRGRAERDPGTV